MPFTGTTAAISGNVFDDANGLSDNIINGTGTNAGGTLYANLVNAGSVEQVVAIAADGKRMAAAAATAGRVVVYDLRVGRVPWSGVGAVGK